MVGIEKVIKHVAPGIIIIKKIDEIQAMTGTENHRIILGQVVAVGPNKITDENALLEAKNFAEVGDVVYFLTYYEEGGYDSFYWNGEKYYATHFGDIRFTLNDISTQ